MSALIDRYRPTASSPLYQDPTIATMPEEEEEEDHSMSESRLSQANGDEDFVFQGRKTHDDDHVSMNKSSMSSMSAFMSSLVGNHAEDWSFCLQVDNAKPRDLPPSSNTTASSDSSSISISRKNGISRWESTPSSSNKAVEFSSKHRTRNMRPWRPPASSNSNPTTNNNNARKADAPMARPQRHDSGQRTLNAMRPQRHDSEPRLNLEMSSTDLGVAAAISSSIQHSSCRHESLVKQQSMDLRVLLECHEEDDMSVGGAEGGEDDDDSFDGGVYLNIPRTMMASERSMWSSASTMTASFRTMASNRSLMSLYSKESIANLNFNNSSKCSLANSVVMEGSHRSLFCKSPEERPIRPPRRTRSRELLHFNSNACERPVRRPVRMNSESTLVSNSTTEETTAVAAASVETDPLLPPLNLYDSSANFSFCFRLIRSLSEQTMDTTWMKETKQLKRSSPVTVRPAMKRTLSDSLLLFTESVSNEQVFAEVVVEEKTRVK